MTRRIQLMVPETPVPEAATRAEVLGGAGKRDGDLARSVEELRRA